MQPFLSTTQSGMQPFLSTTQSDMMLLHTCTLFILNESFSLNNLENVNMFIVFVLIVHNLGQGHIDSFENYFVYMFFIY